MQSKYSTPLQAVIDTIPLDSGVSFTILSWNAEFEAQNTAEQEALFLQLVRQKKPNIIALPVFTNLPKTLQKTLQTTFFSEHTNYAALPSGDLLNKTSTCLTFYDLQIFKGDMSETHHNVKSRVSEMLADAKNAAACKNLRQLSTSGKIFEFEATIQGKPFTLRVLNVLNGSRDPFSQRNIYPVSRFLHNQTTTTKRHHVAIAIGNLGSIEEARVAASVLYTYRPPKNTGKVLKIIQPNRTTFLPLLFDLPGDNTSSPSNQLDAQSPASLATMQPPTNFHPHAAGTVTVTPSSQPTTPSFLSDSTQPEPLTTQSDADASTSLATIQPSTNPAHSAHEGTGAPISHPHSNNTQPPPQPTTDLTPLTEAVTERTSDHPAPTTIPLTRSTQPEETEAKAPQTQPDMAPPPIMQSAHAKSPPP